MNKILLAFILFSMFTACSDSSGSSNNTGKAPAAEAIPAINYGVQKYFAHDTTSYTEGLLFHNGMLFESTGSPDVMPDTRSLVGPVDLTNGKITKKIEINHALFGEGIQHRCLVVRAAVAAQIAVAEIVGEDEHDVRVRVLGAREGHGMAVGGKGRFPVHDRTLIMPGILVRPGRIVKGAIRRAVPGFAIRHYATFL